MAGGGGRGYCPPESLGKTKFSERELNNMMSLCLYISCLSLFYLVDILT